MENNYNEILKEIEPQRREIIINCIEQINGKSDKEIIALVTEAAKEFKEAGKPITKEEQKILMGLMREKLSVEQQKKFDIILNMMGLI